MTYPAGPGSQGVPAAYQNQGTFVADPRYQGGGWWSHGGVGTHFTEAQLETLWINAGGSRQLAPIMAAIAEQRESGGWSGAWNSTGATGLWQIEWPGSAPSGMSREELFTPEGNARAAVRLSGNSLAGVNSNWAGDLQAISVPGFDPAAHLPPGSLSPAGPASMGAGTQAASGCVPLSAAAAKIARRRTAPAPPPPPAAPLARPRRPAAQWWVVDYLGGSIPTRGVRQGNMINQEGILFRLKAGPFASLAEAQAWVDAHPGKK